VPFGDRPRTVGGAGCPLATAQVTATVCGVGVSFGDRLRTVCGVGVPFGGSCEPSLPSNSLAGSVNRRVHVTSVTDAMSSVVHLYNISW
jgi:hypothetical protein